MYGLKQKSHALGAHLFTFKLCSLCMKDHVDQAWPRHIVGSPFAVRERNYCSTVYQRIGSNICQDELDVLALGKSYISQGVWMANDDCQDCVSMAH